MRELADADRLRRLFTMIGAAAEIETNVFVTGGSTAVLLGWRPTTLDADILVVPDSDPVFRALPRIKEELRLNVEIVSPAHFIPELPGWRDRCLFITREALASFYHYDPYAQALAKIERGHEKDLSDVTALFGRGLVEPARLFDLFERIEPSLYRYPSLDPKRFRLRVEEAAARAARA